MPAKTQQFEVFSRTDRAVEGWYWAYRAKKLKRGQATRLRFFDQELVVFRTRSGKVKALDAHCPHMGAHLACGKVDGEGIRCPFHAWKFEGDGKCVDIPTEKVVPKVASQRAWPAEEKYGLIWIWNGPEARTPIPEVPALAGEDVEVIHGTPFVKNCHPSIVMINAIDNAHFNSVHPLVRSLTGPTEFATAKVSENCMTFENVNKCPKTNFVTRLMSHFYAGPLTYQMSYHFGATGTVTLGPDFMPMHLMFCLRPNEKGQAVGQTIMLTKKRRGLFGRLATALALGITRIARAYFAKGDTEIFEYIDFSYQTPVSADRPILEFINHVEAQAVSPWTLVPEQTPAKGNQRLVAIRPPSPSESLKLAAGQP
jgi:phenylpropionate dioxygenase-like ring-hydroxylating dioxygenase large terminal subunit